MNIAGRLVAAKYKAQPNRKPDLILTIRQWEGKSQVTIPAPIFPQFFIRTKDLEAATPALKSDGHYKHESIPIEEAWTADEHEAVTKITVFDPRTVSVRRASLQEAGFRVYEADIPFTRVVERNLRIRENKVRIKDGELMPYTGDVPNIVKGFYDIETDDSNLKVAAKKQRILGITLAEEGKATTWVDQEEGNILKPFFESKKDVDVWVGWGSEDFDDQRIQLRADMLGIPYDPRDVQHFDLLKTLVYREGKRMESLRLDAVVQKVLVDEFKVYPHTIERYKGYYKLFSGEDGGRERLGKINQSHACAVRDIDKYLELLDMRITMADLAGLQIEDTYYYSRIIDNIALREYFDAKPRLIAPCRSDRENIFYEGGLVLDPSPGLHTNVLHFDLVSLYNRIVQTFNISPEFWPLIDKSIFEMKENNDMPLSDKNYEALLGALKGMSEGIFPRKMKELEAWRKQTKAKKKEYEINKESPEYKKWSTLDSTIKTLILAFYGQLGEAKSRYFIPLMAGLVTYAGRELIKATVKWLESMDFKILYGDTDSIFCTLSYEVGDTPEQRTELGKKVKVMLNEWYPKYLEERWGIPADRRRVEIGFEEVYTSWFCGEGKKRYAGIAFGGTEPEVKGFEVVRGDWCPLAKAVQDQVIRMRLNNVPKKDIENYLLTIKNDLLDGKYTTELVISKGQKVKTYKVEPAHVRAAAKLVDRELSAGDNKIHYVVTKADKTSILDVEPIVQGAPFPKIGMSGLIYYWTKQVAPPSFRILWGLFTEEDQDKLLACHYKQPSSMDYWSTVK